MAPCRMRRKTRGGAVSWFSPACWLDNRPAWLPGDVIAGLTLAAYTIPVSLAYTSIATLRPQVGDYGYLPGVRIRCSDRRGNLRSGGLRHLTDDR